MVRWSSDDPSHKLSLPLVAGPESGPLGGRELIEWAKDSLAQIQARLQVHGAILFRGFSVNTPQQFQEFAAVFCQEFGDYKGGNTPRTNVGGHVFTATEYPRDAKISMHNEASYLRQMPRIVLFYCAQPADSGGQTPLADSRRILARLTSAVREKFERNGVRYVNNLHDGSGLGRSWQQVFGTADRREAERRLRADHYEFEWKEDGGLRTSIVAPAVAAHPVTGELAWINQAEQWHPSSLEPETREALLDIMEDEDLPHNAYFGDGSPLDEGELEEIRAAMSAEERVFDWQQGDVLLCDNFLVMHGRRPFTGDRRVLVAMGGRVEVDERRRPSAA
jgi:alpha-ketoglutarate-dependent taurine dioxygenase